MATCFHFITKYMKKILFTGVLVLFFVFSISAQSVDIKKELEVSQLRLTKALDALEKAESLISSLQTENAKRKEINDLNDSIITKKDEVIKNQQRLIETLEKQKGTELSFFFGLIKFRVK